MESAENINCAIVNKQSKSVDISLTSFKYCIMSDGPPATTSWGMELRGQFSIDMIARF